jgi:membrane protease YdiL (CAAX protease family)
MLVTCAVQTFSSNLPISWSVGRPSPRARAAATGVAGAACLAVLPFTGGLPLLAGLVTYCFVLVQSRSTLPWMTRIPYGHVVRRVWRSVAYFLPVLLLGVPDLRPAIAPIALAAGITLAVLLRDWRLLTLNLNPRFTALLPPVSRSERFRDVLYFGSGGAAQEYLYRGVLLAALAPYGGVLAVGVTTALFVAEHLVHMNARSAWDRQDVINHCVLGGTYGAIVYGTGSLAAVMIAHTLFNLPNVVQVLMMPSARTPAKSGAR